MPFRMSSFTIPTIPSFLFSRRCCFQWISANANKFHDNKICYYLVLLSAHTSIACEGCVWNGPLAIIFIWNICVRVRHFIRLIAFRAVKFVRPYRRCTYMLRTYLICMDFCLCVVWLRLLFKVNIWVQWIINIVDYYNDKFAPLPFSRLSCACVFFSKLWAIKYKRNKQKTNRSVQIISHFITPVLLNSHISGLEQILQCSSLASVV